MQVNYHIVTRCHMSPVKMWQAPVSQLLISAGKDGRAFPRGITVTSSHDEPVMSTLGAVLIKLLYSK